MADRRTPAARTNLDIAGDNDFTNVANSGFLISSSTIGGLTADDEARFYVLANLILSGVAAQQTVIPPARM